MLRLVGLLAGAALIAVAVFLRPTRRPAAQPEPEDELPRRDRYLEQLLLEPQAAPAA